MSCCFLFRSLSLALHYTDVALLVLVIRHLEAKPVVELD